MRRRIALGASDDPRAVLIPAARCPTDPTR